MKKYKKLGIVLTFFLTGLIIAGDFSCNILGPHNPTGPDTTNNNFSWTTYRFGGNAASSYFKGVAIINDSDIWAVGQIYTTVDSIYNAAHWNGTAWNLTRIFFRTVCGQPGETAYPASAIIEFGPSDIWISAGDQITQWDGNTEKSITCLPVSFMVNRLWGRSADTVYAVGDGGNILRYYDGMWQQMSSGTTIDLRDIWGNSDGRTIWACGYSNDNSQSILLKYDGTSWKTVWSRSGSQFVYPYGYFVTSVWATDSLTLSSGRGVFRDTTQVVTLPWFPYCIRGDAENDIAVVGDEGMIWHWNGARWEQLNLQPNETLHSVAESKSMIVAVGVDNSVGLGAGLIYMGKRK